MNNTGYLELIVGPMFSGKTSYLINIYNNIKEKEKILVINNDLDNRYSETKIVSHNGTCIPCIKTTKLESLFLNNDINFEEVSIILINEAQFFEDLIPFVKINLIKNKKIYISGLDGDFQQNKFGNIIDLIPLCDFVIKLKANCTNCKTKNSAIFTHRKLNNINQTLIGSDDYYIATCRKCYNLLNNNINLFIKNR